MRFRLLALGLVAGLTCLAAQPATAQADEKYTFGAIGDLPYSAADIVKFPGWIADINADASLGAVIHVGDTKSGSTRCDNDFYAKMSAQLNSFKAPLVYTPGDNEWTDCHREKAGKFHPLGRLRLLRATHFATPGKTLGQQPMRVNSQPGIPENVRYRKAGITFATLHVVGSNNSAVAWKGLGLEAETAEQRLERFDRTQATIAWMKQAFATARTSGDKAVVLAMQADMFVGTPDEENNSSFKQIVRTLSSEAAAFKKPVYLIDGDSHTYTVDTPLSTKSTYTDYYGVTQFAPNLTRITVDGESLASRGWLKFTVQPTGDQPLTWERIAFSSK